MEIKAVDDFMNEDIDALMNTPTETVEKKTINDILDEYDNDLLSFDRDVTQTRAWPAPIRKRICIK